jgi:hypothetical protein
MRGIDLISREIPHAGLTGLMKKKHIFEKYFRTLFDTILRERL